MSTLIIPDVHHHTENADHWLKTQSFERVVFLGDFFDDFGDDVNDARRTALWLRDRMERTDDVFLLGNHDAAYRFPDSPDLYCPGFTPAKSKGIHEILKPSHWDRFQLAHEEQGWLLSHAGFHPSWINGLTGDQILERCTLALNRAKKQIPDPLLGAGMDRGGSERFGGVLWMDWNSLIPIPEINQIVGHTPGKVVREKSTPTSQNYCLDVKNASAAGVITDGKLSILGRHKICYF